MNGEWKDFQLGELATFKYGKFLAKSQLDESGFPVFSGYGIVGYLPTYQFDDPQLLIVCRGEGGTGDVKMSPPNCSITNLSIVFSPHEHLVSKKFLYWALKASDTHRLRTGSAQAQIVIGSLEKFGLVIPVDVEEQDQIAKTLDVLDDRITLLRETNATLEAIAQALFKSWFVDFDPVRAKMEGRAPEGMDEATATLFPDALEESELGWVPKGWRNVSLKEAVSIHDSKRVPLSGQEREKRKGPYPYYGAAALMDTVDNYLFDGVYLLTGEDGSVADTNGYPIMQYVWGKFWVNNHAHILQGKDGVATEHVMLAMQRTNITPYITGAVQAKLSQTNMWRINFLKPTREVSEHFAALIDPLFVRFRHNAEQAQTLATLRDTLLPRLISGQLRLPEAQTATEAALGAALQA